MSPTLFARKNLGAGAPPIPTDPTATALIVVFTIFVVIVLAAGVIAYLRRRARHPPAQAEMCQPGKRKPRAPPNRQTSALLHPDLTRQNPDTESAPEKARSRPDMFSPPGRERSHSASDLRIDVPEPETLPRSERRRSSSTQRLLPLDVLPVPARTVQEERWGGNRSRSNSGSSNSGSGLDSDDVDRLVAEANGSDASAVTRHLRNTPATSLLTPSIGTRKSGGKGGGRYYPISMEVQETDVGSLKGLKKEDMRRLASLRDSGLFPA